MALLAQATERCVKICVGVASGVGTRGVIDEGQIAVPDGAVVVGNAHGGAHVTRTVVPQVRLDHGQVAVAVGIMTVNTFGRNAPRGHLCRVACPFHIGLAVGHHSICRGGLVAAGATRCVQAPVTRREGPA